MCTPKSKDQLRKEEFLQKAKGIAIERGGKCLSTEYISATKDKMLWECYNGHKWEAVYNNVINNKTWCPNCVGKDKTIDDCHNIANENGGKCLSLKYKGCKDKMLWECTEGHQWEATFDNIKNSGSWCPNCAGQIVDLYDCHKIAEERGGKCLSLNYVNKETKMLWECIKGHQWFVNAGKVFNQNTWCPYCLYKSESKCKELLEKYTDLKFLKNRPKWLLNTRGNRMEFDGYNKKHKLAFEYHGEQHYEYNPHFHRNGESDLIQRQEDDKLKEQLAKEHGVRLIVIPYYVDDLETFIYEELMKIDPSLIKLNIDELINAEESLDVL